MEILHADAALYAALVDGKVAVKLGPGSWSPSDAGLPLADGCADWALVTCGNEFAVRVFLAPAAEGADGGYRLELPLMVLILAPSVARRLPIASCKFGAANARKRLQ